MSDNTKFNLRLLATIIACMVWGAVAGSPTHIPFWIAAIVSIVIAIIAPFKGR